MGDDIRGSLNLATFSDEPRNPDLLQSDGLSTNEPPFLPFLGANYPRKNAKPTIGRRTRWPHKQKLSRNQNLSRQDYGGFYQEMIMKKMGYDQTGNQLMHHPNSSYQPLAFNSKSYNYSDWNHRPSMPFQGGELPTSYGYTFAPGNLSSTMQVPVAGGGLQDGHNIYPAHNNHTTLGGMHSGYTFPLGGFQGGQNFYPAQNNPTTHEGLHSGYAVAPGGFLSNMQIPVTGGGLQDWQNLYYAQNNHNGVHSGYTLAPGGFSSNMQIPVNRGGLRGRQNLYPTRNNHTALDAVHAGVNFAPDFAQNKASKVYKSSGLGETSQPFQTEEEMFSKLKIDPSVGPPPPFQPRGHRSMDSDGTKQPANLLSSMDSNNSSGAMQPAIVSGWMKNKNSSSKIQSVNTPNRMQLINSSSMSQPAVPSYMMSPLDSLSTISPVVTGSVKQPLARQTMIQQPATSSFKMQQSEASQMTGSNTGQYYGGTAPIMGTFEQTRSITQGEDKFKGSLNSGRSILQGDDPFTTPNVVFDSDRQLTTTLERPSFVPYTGMNNAFGPGAPPPGPIAPIFLPVAQPCSRSHHLACITPDGLKPSLHVAFDLQNFPFLEPARLASPDMHGVVRISNIPFPTTRAEIIAFFGRNSRIVKEKDEPIHVIMERVTGKTMDAFVEFMTIEDAVAAVERYSVNRIGGRGGRLGDRYVELEVCGQENLMQQLFPKANNVHWHGATPEILTPDYDDRFNSGFKGFVSSEELVMLEKNVHSPHRCTFVRDCPQRPYECMISTLAKFPWYAVDYITVEDRDRLFDAAKSIVVHLNEHIRNEAEDSNLNSRLLSRLQRAIFRCHGFTQSQKDDISFVCDVPIFDAFVAPYADHWYVFKALGPNPDSEPDVIMYYIALLREATMSPDQVSLAEMAKSGPSTRPSAFGNMNIGYPTDWRQMSLSAIAHIEWTVIDKLLRVILPN